MEDEFIRNNAYVNTTTTHRINTMARAQAMLFRHTGISSVLIFQPPITDQEGSKRVCMINQGDEVHLINAALRGMCKNDVTLERYTMPHLIEDDPNYFGCANQPVNGLDDLPDIGQCITQYREERDKTISPESIKRGTMYPKFAARMGNANAHLHGPSWNLMESLKCKNGEDSVLGGRLRIQKRKRPESDATENKRVRDTLSGLRKFELNKTDSDTESDSSMDTSVTQENDQTSSKLSAEQYRKKLDCDSIKQFHDDILERGKETCCDVRFVSI